MIRVSKVDLTMTEPNFSSDDTKNPSKYSTKENQRVRMSKRLLRDSLTALLYEKSIQKISVREICDRAEVNRTTFYKYYGSQYDLLEDMEREVMTLIDGYLAGPEESPETGPRHISVRNIVKIMTFADEQPELCRILVNNNVDPEFPAKLVKWLSTGQFLSLPQVPGHTENDPEYIFSFLVNGSFSLIKSWLNKEKRDPPERIAGLLTDMMERFIPAPLQ
ncbi:MAG: TetR/AcrR family transcriptional regulator [Oscillospiraceae bacterium]|jgi:AcrR family transcriptional regulator|nr:TetR/AcrR family transcriptional regulator [Oscillospiraceae bacterium]